MAFIRGRGRAKFRLDLQGDRPDTNPSLFSSLQIDPASGRMTLAYAPQVLGSSRLTVRARTAGTVAEATFSVTVVDPVGILYWTGGSSSWDLNSVNWNTAADGSGGQIEVGSGRRCGFRSDGRGAVTVSGPMVAGEIDFAASITALSSGSLTVNGGIALNSGVTASITSAIAGMHGPEIYGGGTLTLGGSDSGNRSSSVEGSWWTTRALSGNGRGRDDWRSAQPERTQTRPSKTWALAAGRSPTPVGPRAS